MNLRLAGIQGDSIVDGPGIRLSIYFQGCSHNCPGCHNPETHDPLGGYDLSLDQVVDLIDRSSGIDGVTISGGEPFEQTRPVAALAVEVVKKGLNLVIYSGFSFENLLARSLKEPEVRSLLESAWLLVDGPFIMAEQDLTLSYRGSRNQRLIDLSFSIQSGRAVEWSFDFSN